MKHIYSALKDIANKFSGRDIILFLDYDGTLAPIADTPEKAVFPKDTKRILDKLRKNPKCKIAVISGRALKDVKKMVGIKEIIYVGNHGVEIDGIKGGKSPSVSKSYINLLTIIKKTLQDSFSGISGVFIDDKHLTLSVHYRLADKENIPKIKKIFYESIKPFLYKKGIKITRGKMVFEIRPLSKWDKGKIVLWILNKLSHSIKNKMLPVYIGDDVTDEDAFRALKKKGLTIFVGRPKRSNALYNINSADDVREFLNYIFLFLTERKNAGTNKGKRTV